MKRTLRPVTVNPKSDLDDDSGENPSPHETFSGQLADADDLELQRCWNKMLRGDYNDT